MRVAQFYGWSLSEIRRLNYEDFEFAWQAITIIEARDMLLQMKIADYPHLKPSQRSKIHKEIYKQAHPKLEEMSKAPMTMDRLKAAILGGMNGGR